MISSDRMEVDGSFFYNFRVKKAVENPNKPYGLHGRILRLYSDCLDVPQVRLYLSFFLEKAANWSTAASVRVGRPCSIRQMVHGSSADYFRSLSAKSYCFSEIQKAFFSAEESGIPIYPVRNARSVQEELRWCYGIFEPKTEEELFVYLKELTVSTCSQGSGIISLDALIYAAMQKGKDNGVADLVIHYKKLTDNILKNSPQVDYTYIAFCSLNGQDFFISASSVSNERLMHFWSSFFTPGGHIPTIIQREELLLNLRGFQFPLPCSLNTESVNWADYHFAAGVLQRLPVVEGSYSSLFSLLYYANRELLAGLASSLTALTGSDMQKVIPRSLRSIEESMLLMFQNQKNHSIFTFQHELIAEEILLLLNLTRPYHSGCFSEIVRNRIQQTVPQIAIIPQVIPFSSGMHTLQEILKALRSITDLRIAPPSILYFEIEPLLDDEELLNIENPNFAFFSFRTLLNEEVHYNSYLTICKEIDALLQVNATQKQPLFVAVDVTLDKLQSKTVYRLIKHYQTQIQSQALSIVLFRSSQKFDQLGVDKFNAGYLELYSEIAEVSSAFTQLVPDQLQGLDYQALCHYHRCIPNAIHHYPKFHYKNVRHFQELADADAEPFENFEVLMTEDSKMPFFRLELSDDFVNNKPFKDALWKTMDDWKIPCSSRQSFGYHQPTVTFNIFQEIIYARIGIGTASAEEVSRFYQALKEVDQQLNPFSDKEA